MKDKYKILNLYACLGGNRYKWDEVTDVDNSNKKINVIKTSAIVVLTIVILFFIFPRLGTSLLMLLKKFMFLLPMLLNFLPI